MDVGTQFINKMPNEVKVKRPRTKKEHFTPEQKIVYERNRELETMHQVHECKSKWAKRCDKHHCWHHKSMFTKKGCALDRHQANPALLKLPTVYVGEAIETDDESDTIIEDKIIYVDGKAVRPYKSQDIRDIANQCKERDYSLMYAANLEYRRAHFRELNTHEERLQCRQDIAFFLQELEEWLEEHKGEEETPLFIRFKGLVCTS